MRHEILTVIGKNCITPGDGQHLYDLVHPELLAERIFAFRVSDIEPELMLLKVPAILVQLKQ